MSNIHNEKTMEFSVPQGAFLFISYASTLDEVVPNDMQLNLFADYPSIRKAFKLRDEPATIVAMESTMLDVKYWIKAVHLKMKESKIEFIYFRSKHMLKTGNINMVNIN